MKTVNQTVKHALWILFLLALMASCASIPYLTVDYRLPPQTDELKGKKVFLAFEDARAGKDIIGDGARKAFTNFSGNISFSLARGNEPGFRMGVYDLPSLFMEAFKKRLETLGLKVLSERERGQVEVVIVLKEFLLDLIGRSWKITLDYEARLVRDKRVVAKQMISGSAERLKLVGRKQADVVVSEIFTDVMNKLDVGRLFEQAGL